MSNYFRVPCTVADPRVANMQRDFYTRLLNQQFYAPGLSVASPSKVEDYYFIQDDNTFEYFIMKRKEEEEDHENDMFICKTHYKEAAEKLVSVLNQEEPF
jgi:hypothetical protein